MTLIIESGSLKQEMVCYIIRYSEKSANTSVSDTMVPQHVRCCVLRYNGPTTVPNVVLLGSVNAIDLFESRRSPTKRGMGIVWEALT